MRDNMSPEMLHDSVREVYQWAWISKKIVEGVHDSSGPSRLFIGILCVEL